MEKSVISQGVAMFVIVSVYLLKGDKSEIFTSNLVLSTL